MLSAEQVWWERVRRAIARRGREGQRWRLTADWAHDMLRVRSAAPGRMGLVDGAWGPMPLERCTEEYKQRETRRLNDELGVRLGVGPMP